MIIIVDTNIVFSAIISAEGTISDLLLNSSDTFNFFAPTIILEELDNHNEKIKKISGLNQSDLNFLKRILLRKIDLIDLETISEQTWKRAIELTKDVDEFDAPFIALSLELNVPLWTGDKKLKNGLENKGIDGLLDTQTIKQIRDGE